MKFLCVLGRKLPPVMALAALALLGFGCPETAAPPASDIEEVVSYTGELLVTLPTGEEVRYIAPASLPELPSETLIEVISGKLEGVLMGVTVQIREGQTARLTEPALAVEKIISFTGRLRIILPTDEVILVEPGQILPPLPPGTRIVVLSGELTVIAEGQVFKIGVGQIGRIVEVEEFEPEIEIGVIEDRAPISPFRP